MSGVKDSHFGDAPYPGSPGFKESTTSRDAARSVAGSAGDLREMVMRAIRETPSTADEVAARLELSVLTVRPRCSELRKMNKIRPRLLASGRTMRRFNESGCGATVWEENA